MLEDPIILDPGCGTDGPHLTQSHHLGKVSFPQCKNARKKTGIHAHVYCMGARASMCTCVWRPEGMSGFAQLLSTLFIETVSPPEVWTHQVCLLEYFSLSKVSAFWTLGLQAITVPTWHLYWSWRCKLMPSCLWGRHLTQWSTLQAPVWYFSTRMLIMCWTSHVTVLPFPYHCFVVGTIQLHYPN